MTVLWCRQVRANTISGGIEHQEGSTIAVVRRTVPYLAKTNNVNDELGAILASPLVPQLYQPYVADPSMRVSKVDGTRLSQNPLLWEIVVEYSTATPTSQEVQNGDPLGAPIKRSLDSYSLQIPMQKDLDGKWVKATNGLLFDPPPMVEYNPWILNCMRNEPVFSMSQFHAYHDTVNSTSFNGVGAGYVKCLLRVDEQYAFGMYYYGVNYKFIYNPLGWQPKIANQGFIELVPGPRLRRITDDEGREVTQPYPLTEAGQALPSSELDDIPSPLIFLDFRAYNTNNYNALGLI